MATTTTNLGLTLPAVNDAADISVLNANFDKIDEKCNPALFSPSGYGLGLTGSHLTALTDANEAQRNGWYLINKNIANGVGQMAIVRVDCEAWAHCVQTAYSASYSSSTPMIMRRVKNSGTWKDWEWVNPPMTAGVVYRTTERYNGAAVYAKLVYVANLPNNASKTVDGVIDDGITRLVDLQYTVNNSWTKKSHDSRVDMMLGVESPYAWLTITTTADMSTYSGYVLIKWTKD